MSNYEQEINKRELTIWEILIASWVKYKENINLIALITLIVYVPINIFLTYIPIEHLIEQLGWGQGMKVYMRIVWFLEFLIGIIAFMAIAFLVESKINGKSVDLGEALKKSLSRWNFALITNFLLYFALVGLTLLFIIPGIIFYYYWIFVPSVVILREKSWSEALNYSKSIVKDRWWKVAGYTLVFGLLGLLVQFAYAAIYLILPANLFSGICVAIDTAGDIIAAYFTVVFVMFFINFDNTKILKTESMQK